MRSLIFLLLFLFSCSNQKDKTTDYLLLYGIIDQTKIYDLVDCQKSYTMNEVYISGGYAQRFATDLKQYQNVAITDSTWDISKSFPNFFDSNITQMNSTAGDTLCDFNARFTRSIKTINPINIIVSTVGGNDFLSGKDDSTIISTFNDFNFRLKNHFRNSNIIYIKVHRTFLEHINVDVERVTPELMANSLNACWVEPAPCFSKPVKSSEFLPNDKIHYSESAAFCIKREIKNQCGIEF